MNGSTLRHAADSAAAPSASPAAPAATAPADANWWRPLVGTTLFFMIPALVLFVPRLAGSPLPVGALYAIAAGCGLVLALRVFSDPEWILATFVLYLPFSRIYIASVAPGVNATNVLSVLVILAWIGVVVRDKRPFFQSLPGNRIMGLWAALSLLSIVTAMLHQGAWFITTNRLPNVKAWIDQFFVFFAVLNLIRNGAAARRVAVYMVVGTVLVVMFAFNEWLDKRWLSSIEKARLLGPQQQPNDLGAFIVYGLGIPGALVLVHLWRIRTWLVATPLLYMSARVLLATFSRGAVIGLAALVAALLAVRGRVLAMVLAIVGAVAIQVVPEVLPESLQARMSQTTNEDDGELDKSSQTRLILWDAAIKMTLDYPLLGGGFQTFPVMKDQYATEPTRENDNHNMFLYIASQMGIPALIVFLVLILRMAWIGLQVHRSGNDSFARTIGLGAIGTAAGVLGINMFGSRMTDVAVMAYVWITLAVVIHLWREVGGGAPAAETDRSTI